MGETSKRKADREATGWFTKYCSGRGVDIGCGDDPVLPDCDKWDLPQGDAQYLAGVDDATYDWVYSSHCLEHVHDPSEALRNWWRVLKPGGHLIVMVPDEDLYEQGMWPPAFNVDHKSTWTVWKAQGQSWSPASRNMRTELEALPGSRIVSLKRHEKGYDYTLQQRIRMSLVIEDMDLAKEIEVARELTPGMLQRHPRNLRHIGFFPIDQTASPLDAEVSIEGIARKECKLNS